MPNLKMSRSCGREKNEQVFPEVVDVKDWRRGFSLAAGHPTSFLAWVDAVIVGAS